LGLRGYALRIVLSPSYCASMIGENQQLVEPVEVQDYKKITDHSRGIYGRI
jgi:hypothetical protein